MEYAIRFTDDGRLPPGHDWAICRMNGQTELYLRASLLGSQQSEAAAVLESAWAGFRNLTERD